MTQSWRWVLEEKSSARSPADDVKPTPAPLNYPPVTHAWALLSIYQEEYPDSALACLPSPSESDSVSHTYAVSQWSGCSQRSHINV